MKLNLRLVIFAIATIFGIAFSIPSLLQTEEGKKINLGLDLQGGLHMLLGVKSEEAIKSRIKSIATGIGYYTDKNDILIDSIKIDDEKIHIAFLDIDDRKILEEHISKIEFVKFVQDGFNFYIELTEDGKIAIQEQALNQAVETIRNRLDQFGLSEPTVAKQGEDKILVELPGIKTAEEEQRARNLIAKSAQLYLMAVDEAHQSKASVANENIAKGYGDLLLSDVSDEEIKYLVKAVPILDGARLINANVVFNEMQQPVITFKLDTLGAEVFGNFTGKNVGNHLAIVLDGKVFSAPVINERIGGGSGQISGNFKLQEAQDLAIALRSGALLAPVYVMEKRSVGPSLGADSITSATIALISGFLLVIIFMLFYYGTAGIVSNIALVVNLFLILSLMSLFGATLTLPGMAGIVLTVGMAVDANVIINERVRELLYSGKSLAKSISEGYDKAITAILDANITTLIASVVLYAYGNGPIKGFAITISIGILASMLTAILGTRGIYDAFFNKLSSRGSKVFGIKALKKENN
jgi:preprotein translocase subunit SecD